MAALAALGRAVHAGWLPASRRVRRPPPDGAVTDLPVEVVTAVEKELTQLGVADTAAGRAAVELARNLGSPVTPPSAKAALARELRATLAVATAGGRRSSSPTDQARDELVRRRAGRAVSSAAGEAGP